MWQIVKEILRSDAGSFGAGAALIFLVVVSAFKAGAFLTKFKVIDKLEQSINDIKETLYQIKASISNLESKFSHLENKFSHLDRRVNAIEKKDSPLYQSQSPVTLTQKGKDLSEKLKAREAVSASWDKIKEYILADLLKRKDNNLYTIQEICFEIGRKHSKYFSDHDMNRIKMVAFQNGYNLYEFDMLFGIEIRDKYFEEEGLNQASIDEYEPDKE